MKRRSTTKLTTPDEVDASRVANQERNRTNRQKKQRVMGANSEQRGRELTGLRTLQVNLSTRDEELKLQIAQSIVRDKAPEGSWFDPSDSFFENYLRRVSWHTNYGSETSVILSLLEVVEDVNRAMENLMRDDTLGRHHMDQFSPEQILSKLTAINRAYVEKNHFLDEPIEGEQRRCARGLSCLCLVMAVRIPGCVDDLGTDGNGFVGREFLLPRQLEKYQEDGTLPHYNRHCLVCNRAITCMVWTKCVNNGVQSAPYAGDQPVPTNMQEALPQAPPRGGGGEDPFARVVKQMMRDWSQSSEDAKRMLMCMDHYYNRLDTEGEYRQNVCLSMSPNTLKTSTPYHFIEYASNRYKYARRPSGTRFLEECKVFYRVGGSSNTEAGARKLPDF